MCCGKLILFVSNAIIFVLGAVVVGIASVTIHKGSGYGELLSEGIVSLPIIILILGLIVCLISFFGWFGTLKESKCMLYTYSGIMLVMFLGEIVVAILLIAHPNLTSNALEKFLDNQFEKYEQDPDLADAIDNMQHDLECCGVDGPDDWEDKHFWSQSGAPWSCCYETEEKGPCKVDSIMGVNDAYVTGCKDALIDEYKDITLALGIIGIVLALFLIFAMFTSCGLARKQP